jgi:predicted TIM-barrel fold metal-dependent hydrolase
MRKKTDPELPLEPPLWFGNISNGEYFRFATRKDRLIRKMILEKADENARYIGMDRRQFLASAMGMATTLYTIAHVSACSSDGSAKDVGNNIKKGAHDAMVDPECAASMLDGNEFIFDVQTHWFKKDDLEKFPLYIQLFGRLFDVATEDNYIRQMFCNSQTTVACLTAWPGVSCTGETVMNCGLPLSNESNAASRDKINKLAGGAPRILNHMQVMVQDPNGVEAQLALMEEAQATYGLSAWKMYPGFMPIFKLDDERGRAVIQKGLELGVNRFCVHKGLPIGTFFDWENGNLPNDIGPVAKDYKDANFVVYHSAIIAGSKDTASAPDEGPYDPNEATPKGVNTLIRTMQENGIGPNQNVYGEVGSAINQVQSDPVQAAHFFGKLMKHVGTDNVLWGTDCIIYGSPQPFIEWFRGLEIPQSMQEEFGYPALDAAQKRKILGENAAKLYGVDIEKTRCAIECSPTAKLKEHMDEELGPRRWAFDEPGGPSTYEQYAQESEENQKRGRPG